MPKAFSRQEKETIRAQMREKGKKLFEQQGLKKTSVNEITEAVGISKGAFYLFFESKEELYLEILEELEQEVQTRILEIAIQPKDDARKKLGELVNNFLLTWDAYPLLKNFGRNEFDYLVRKIPARRVKEHASLDEVFINQLIKKIKSEGLPVKTSLRIVSNLIKCLVLVSLQREDLGEAAYEEAMGTLTDLVAGYVVGA